MNLNILKFLSLFILFIKIKANQQNEFSSFENKNPFGKQRYNLAILQEENPEDYYLPKTMIPHAYDLILNPNLEINKFAGLVTIYGSNEEAIDTIVLHTLNQAIYQIEAYVNETYVEIIDRSIDTEKEFLILKFAETISASSRIRLVFTYEGIMDTTMKNRGFYIATYKDENGKEKRLGTTHMEPTNAREVFPCFDEPALKAKFDIRIVRPKNYNSKSNMPIIKIITNYTDSGKEMDIFLTTPPMSTYLVAFVVSEFETISASYPKQATHELHADLADLKKHYGDVGLLASRQVLSALIEYTGHNYSLPKIGQVAIPTGYFGGAMENWGLVIYGEWSLLFKPGVSTEIERQGVFNIISHEYAHQWFGNLVGPESWAYTWLNEGFATFFTMLIPTITNPEWRYVEQFAFKIPYAMSHDALDNSRPMTMPVGKPENIRATFDVIAYDKAACVLRMFEHAIGKENFRKSLNIYIDKCRYRAANDNHLTSSFSEALQDSNPDLATTIKSKFDTWHLQKGFPLISVTRNYENNTMTLTQEHFLTSNNQSSQIWSIPINYFYLETSHKEKIDTTAQFWLTEKSQTVSLPEEAKDSFIILNKGYTGYYRVNYDMQNWKLITENSDNFKDMSMNRVQLIEDAFTLALNNRLDMNIAIDLFLNLLDSEDNYLVVKASVAYFDRFLEVFQDYSEVKELMINLYRKAYVTYSNVEFDGDYIQSLIRNELIPRICRLGYDVCLEEMHQHMREEFVLNSPNLQESIVCAGMMLNADADDKFTFIIERINNSIETEVRSRLMNTLPCIKDATTSKRLLDWIVYPETNILHWSDITLLRKYCNDYDNAKLAMTYFLEKFSILEQTYSFETLRNFMLAIASKIYSQEVINIIEDFVKSTPLTEIYKNMFMEVINTIKANINKIENSPFLSPIKDIVTKN